MVEIYINGIKSMALVDIDCFQSLISKSVCCFWEKRKLDVLTETHKCLRISNVKLIMGNRNPFLVKVLITERKLSEFNFLLGPNTITELSVVQITQSENVCFPRDDVPVYVAIKVNDINFSAEFDQNKNIWIALGKWLDG